MSPHARLHTGADCRADYLQIDEVDRFVDHLARLLGGQPFPHQFQVRDKHLPPGYRQQRLAHDGLRLSTLEQAFDAYWWNGQGYEANRERLERVQGIVRHAIACEDTHQGTALCLEAIHEVLKWGAGGEGSPLYRANRAWSVDRCDSIVARMRAGRAAMTSECPDLSVFGSSEGPRMNAGYTKYYALACDGVVIYDGRVGAAMGLAVKRFCQEQHLDHVPDALAFRWGAQNPGQRSAEWALHRNPSDALFRFSQLPTTGGPHWARCNVWANWILKSAQARAPDAAWCQSDDGLRRIEAALFTIGYRLPHPDGRGA